MIEDETDIEEVRLLRRENINLQRQLYVTISFIREIRISLRERKLYKASDLIRDELKKVGIFFND